MKHHLPTAAALLLLVPASAAARPADVQIINTTPIPVIVADPVTVQSTPSAPVYAAPTGEARFSVRQEAVSNDDTSTKCTKLDTLPAGALLIESVDVWAATSAMMSYLSIPVEANQPYYFGARARIPVPLAVYPGQEGHGHTATSVVIRDGLDTAVIGEPVRDATHSVEICLRDTTTSGGFYSIWTISGRVLR